MSYSTKQLFGVMLVIAVGLVALASADKEIIATIARQAVMVVLVIAAYGIWASQGETRAFRIGFVIWAGCYYLLHVVLNVGGLRFSTSYLLSVLRPTLLPGAYIRDPSGTVTRVHGSWFDNYDVIGHSFFSILFGLVGGMVTAYFYRKRQRMLSDQRSLA